MEYVKVAKTEDFEPKKAVMAKVGDEEIAIFAVDGRYYAVEETCPHRDGPLHEGLVEGTTVTCPWHFAKFDLTNGNVIEPPASTSIKTYEVKVEGNDVLVAIPSKTPL